MTFFNDVIDVAKDIGNEVKKDIHSVQNAYQFIPGGHQAMAVVRQMTGGKLGGDDVHYRTAEQNLRDMGRAGSFAATFVPVGMGVKAGANAAKYGRATIRGVQNLRTGKNLVKARSRDIKMLKRDRLMPISEKKVKIADMRNIRKKIVKGMPAQAKVTAKNAVKTLGFGSKSSAGLVPALSPKSQEGVSKRKRLAQSTAATAKKVHKKIKDIGGMI